MCAGKQRVKNAAWSYPDPVDAVAAIKGYLGFYPHRLACYVDRERVRAQAEHAIAETHKNEIDALKAEYEARIASLRAEYEAEARDRVARGLMTLAGYAKRGAEA